MTRTTLFGVVILGFVASACHDDPPEDTVYDFSGSVLDLAMTVSSSDAATPNADLAGYDLTCDPSTMLSGGEPKGHWQYHAACASPEALFQLQMSCPGIAIDGLKVTSPSGAGAPSGSLSLSSGGMFSRSTQARLTAHATVPSSCTQPFGGCPAYGSGQAAQFNWLEITCQPAGNNCSCAIAVDISKNDTGTWSSTSSGFTTTAAQGGPQSFTVSVSGNTLKHRGDSSSLRGDRGITYVLIR